MPCRQNTGLNYNTKTRNKSFENAHIPALHHSWVTSRFSLGNACHHSVKNSFSSCLAYRNGKIKLWKLLLCGLLESEKQEVKHSGVRDSSWWNRIFTEVRLPVSSNYWQCLLRCSSDETTRSCILVWAPVFYYWQWLFRCSFDYTTRSFT